MCLFGLCPALPAPDPLTSAATTVGPDCPSRNCDPAQFLPPTDHRFHLPCPLVISVESPASVARSTPLTHLRFCPPPDLAAGADDTPGCPLRIGRTPVAAPMRIAEGSTGPCRLVPPPMQPCRVPGPLCLSQPSQVRLRQAPAQPRSPALHSIETREQTTPSFLWAHSLHPLLLARTPVHIPAEADPDATSSHP